LAEALTKQDLFINFALANVGALQKKPLSVSENGFFVSKGIVFGRSAVNCDPILQFFC